MSTGQGLEQTTDAVRPREFIEQRVRERAARLTAEQVAETCSFARAERIFGREYHGRFLIELLQNAADAWRSTREGPEARTDVRIVLSDAPALLVANKGTTFPADVVVESLGHIGRSTKSRGEAIGHKGIGFKSVLELTLTPELYSGLAEETPSVAVRFDPRAASDLIRASSPDWDALVAGVGDVRQGDELSAVPILRYPEWVDDLPSDVAELRAAGFDTVVRLPFNDDLRPDSDLGFQAWLDAIRKGFLDLTDQTLLLLGTFRRIEVEDRIAGTQLLIEPTWHTDSKRGSATTREEVTVERNGDPSSRWLLYRRTTNDVGDLSGEIAAGIRRDVDTGRVIAAEPRTSSTPFYLFFPTRIGSGLPFLLHGYFEVDAARTGFYQGSSVGNGAILDAVAELVGDAVRDMAGGEPTALAGLADLLGEAGVPEDDRAQQFHERVLAALDDIAWVPIEPLADGSSAGRPSDLLVDEEGGVVEFVAATFPADYVRERAESLIPARAIAAEGRRYLSSRQPDQDVWPELGALLRPGAGGPWPMGQEEEGFRALLRLFDALQLKDPEQTNQLLSALREDPEACLLPAVAEGGAHTLLPIPDPDLSVPGKRSRLVMARIESVGQTELVPPQSMDVAFLPAGLLTESELTRAAPLGVRPFTVDNVLDRLGDRQESETDRAATVTFLWSLLSRQRVGEFSTRVAAERAGEFNPVTFFWCRPGHGKPDGGGAPPQRRRRVLAQTYLPSRSGEWRPACELAFGDDWAEWLEQGERSGSSAARQRTRCYRALDEVAPSGAHLLARPDVVLPLLNDVGAPPADDSDRSIELQQHGFLLLLGVWEVLPVRAFESWDHRKPGKFPFGGPLDEVRRHSIELNGGWTFGNDVWEGGAHGNPSVAEDFSFLWPLADAANRDPGQTAFLLSSGSTLYRGLDSLAAFCQSCTSGGKWHRRQYRTSRDDWYPSILALELRNLPWVPALLDGEDVAEAQTASSVWWTERPPTGPGLHQSPYRFLTLCRTTDVAPELRLLAQIPQLETADAGRLESLLTELRDDYQDRAGTTRSRSGRQAFIGLHRLVYDRLADLSVQDSEARGVLARVGILCDRGGQLVFEHPDEARHDDRRYASFRRYFEGQIPFAVVRSERVATARHLGIRPFEVELTRRPSSEPVDVTAEVADVLGDRLAELLAIVVNHSLGTQTLETTSVEFSIRARRLQDLRVLRVDDLVIDARVVGSGQSATLGEGAAEDTFLERPSGADPVLFHDLGGEEWKATFRRKLPRHLATLLENPAYEATFALFLLADTEDEREEALRDLGISSENVDEIRAIVGVVSEEGRARRQRWFDAVLRALGYSAAVDAAQVEEIRTALQQAGLSAERALHLARLGGSDDVREDASPDGALSVLDSHGLPLVAIDEALRRADPADGLLVAQAPRLLSAWVKRYRRYVSAVLATRLDPEVAKRAPDTWNTAPELRLALRPAPEQWLEPVIASLRAAGMDANPESLAGDPIPAITKLSGVATVEELDALVAQLFDREEQQRILSAAANAWRKQLAFVAVLNETTPGSSRSAIRAQAARVEQVLPVAPTLPSELRPSAAKLFEARPGFAGALGERLTDVLAARPERAEILSLAASHGMATAHRLEVERALEKPRSESARKLKASIAQLRARDLRPVAPAGISPAEPPPRTENADGAIKKVAVIKVGVGADASKRRAGDEGERWALAAVLGDLIQLSVDARRSAIGEMVALLSKFTGPVVDRARQHAEPACDAQLDEGELIEELTELLHVSQLSDGFGFDLIGWLPLQPDAEPIAVCLEVKSTRDGKFHLSRNEWDLATKFHEQGAGAHYVVLVIHRGAASEPPRRIDILADPVALVADNQITKLDDGYQLAYRAAL